MRPEDGTPEIVIITGLSGAGRSTAAKSLEDLDWFVADNLPPDLLPMMTDLARRAKDAVPRLAAVVDVRSRAFSTDLKWTIVEIVRRPHPLQETGRVIDGIAAEREQLRGLSAAADLVIDTSGLNVHELRARMRERFSGDAETGTRVNVVSFGFKYGLPVDADTVADCRFLPNPHWVTELAPLTGQDERVRDYVLSQPGAAGFLRAYVEMAQITLAGYEREGKHFALLALGCTGGKHRSVVIAEEIAARLAGTRPGVRVAHRDLGRE